MPLVTVKEKFQVTIPAKVRDQVTLHVGDVLEASVEEGAIVLRPKVVVDRAALAGRLQEILAGTPTAPEFAGKSEQEIMGEVAAEIEAARAERRRDRA